MEGSCLGRLKTPFRFVVAILGLLSCAGLEAELPTEFPRPALPAVEAYYGGDLEKAAAILEARLGTDGPEVDGLRELAAIYREMGDDGRLLQTLRTLRAVSGDASFENEFFIALCMAGRYDEASALLPLAAPSAFALFNEAVLRREKGEDPLPALEASLRLDARRPAAHYLLGLTRSERGEYAAAEAAFSATLRVDAGMTAALPPLAEAIHAGGRPRDAYALAKRSLAALPGHPRLLDLIRDIEARYPELSAERSAAAAARKARTSPPRVAPAPATEPPGPLVRVGIAEGLGWVSLKVGGSFVLEMRNQNPPAAEALPLTADLPSGVLVTVGEVGGFLEVRGQNGEILGRSSSAARFLPVDPSATTVVFDLLAEGGSFFAAVEDRAYRGIMEVRLTQAGITVVNEVPLEDYLYSVVPSEMPAGWPAEALKAQAVAARSYTLAAMGRFAVRGFDVHGSVLSAAYRGVKGEAAATTAAVDATRGVRLTWRGRPLEAFYSANSGGHTEDSRFVWKADAGMAAVPDAGPAVGGSAGPRGPAALSDWLDDRPASHSAWPTAASVAYRWQVWVPASVIGLRIAADRDIGPISSIRPRGRGPSGRVYEVEVVGETGSIRVRGDRIRHRLGGLRSNLFTVQTKRNADGTAAFFVFTGGGWGHGVGLCQSGAAGMAAAGFDFRGILAHYYPRAALETLP